MKKLSLLMALGCFSFFSNAQTLYKAFKFDIDFGYAIPADGPGTKAGATFTLEPHYRLSNAFALGFRVEGAALAYKTINDSGNSDFNGSILGSGCLTGDIYLSSHGFRPFIGFGGGVFVQKYKIGGGDSTTYNNGPAQSLFGFFPRVGFETGGFRMSATYNVIGSNYNYAAFTIGFYFGGGKKKTPVVSDNKQ